jgi:hypothetical protein
MCVLEQDPPCPWNAETCAHAVKEGYLEIIIEMGAKPRSSLPMGHRHQLICRQGRLFRYRRLPRNMKWAREQVPPCPWDAGACALALVKGGNPEMLRWAQDHLRT